jgi:hypothetical protein
MQRVAAALEPERWDGTLAFTASTRKAAQLLRPTHVAHVARGGVELREAPSDEAEWDRLWSDVESAPLAATRRRHRHAIEAEDDEQAQVQVGDGAGGCDGVDEAITVESALAACATRRDVEALPSANQQPVTDNRAAGGAAALSGACGMAAHGVEGEGAIKRPRA